MIDECISLANALSLSLPPRIQQQQQKEREEKEHTVLSTISMPFVALQSQLQPQQNTEQKQQIQAQEHQEQTSQTESEQKTAATKKILSAKEEAEQWEHFDNLIARECPYCGKFAIDGVDEPLLSESDKETSMF